MEVLVFIVMILYSLCSICFPTAVHTCSGCSNLSSWFIVDKHVKFRLWLIQEKKRKRITIFYFCLFFSFINQRLTTGELKSWDPDICSIWLFVHGNEMVFITDLMSLKIESVNSKCLKIKLQFIIFWKRLAKFKSTKKLKSILSSRDLVTHWRHVTFRG